jgi:hypothetical protein
LLTYIQAIYSVTRSFDDHNVHVPEASDTSTLEKGPIVAPATNSRNIIFTNLNAGFKRAFSGPRPLLPIVNTGITSSTQGILEKSKQEGQLSAVVSITRSVHFSPDTSRQSRGFTIDNTLGSVDQKGSVADSTPPESSSSLEESNSRISREVNPNAISPEQYGRVMVSRVGRRGASIENQGLSFY